MPLTTFFSTCPLGKIVLTLSHQGIRALNLEPFDANDVPRSSPTTLEGRAQLAHDIFTALEAYFSGQPVTFDFPLDPVGTPFQRLVWEKLVTIPYGSAVSYGDLAKAIDKPKAVRAVGQAVGRNPVSIIIPCHRVIGASGAMTGFGHGIPVKEYLLRLEGWEIGRGPIKGSHVYFDHEVGDLPGTASGLGKPRAKERFSLEVVHVPDAQRYEIRLNEQRAVLDYRDHPEYREFYHTSVPPAFRGRGLAAKLVKQALTEAKAQNKRVLPTCSYVASYLARHPEFQDLIASPNNDSD